MAKSKKTQPDSAPSFESTIATLTALIEKLEGEDIPLSEALDAFEEGVKTTREAQQQISQADQRLQMLIEENGVPLLKDIDINEGS